MKTVVIFHRIIAPYRVPFYKCLQAELEASGIRLRVVYGQAARHEKEPFAELDTGTRTRATYFYLGRRFLVWLPVVRQSRGADLVIVQQANINLHVYALAALRSLHRFKLAFWGHGRDFQCSNTGSIGERVKRIYSRYADYWFAYTDVSRRIVEDMGYPAARIASVENAIDTTSTIRAFENISDGELDLLRARYGMGREAPAGVFCSRLYKAKGIDFLLSVAGRLRARVPGLHFFVIGDGPEAGNVRSYAATNGEWFHWVGTKDGPEKCSYFKLARFQLIPGVVGLNIVDSFAMLTPLVTTDIKGHGPEIAYLQNHVNGVMTPHDEGECAEAALRIVTDPAYHGRLVAGCAASRRRYSIENMAARFSCGVRNALEMPPLRWRCRYGGSERMSF